LSQLALARLRCSSMRTQSASPAVGAAGRSSFTALVWCFLALIVPGLVAGALIHDAGAEFALGGLLSAGLGVSAAYSGWALTSKRWSGTSPALIGETGGRRLLVASVLSQLWWFALASRPRNRRSGSPPSSGPRELVFDGWAANDHGHEYSAAALGYQVQAISLSTRHTGLLGVQWKGSRRSTPKTRPMTCLAATVLGMSSETWIAIGTVATAIVALCAFVGAIYQLYQTRRSTRETRALEFLRRYDDPDLVTSFEKAHIIVRTKGELSADEKRARSYWWDNLSYRDQFEVEIALNFWEEMATMYNRKLVDQKLIEEYFGESILDFWKKSKWLLMHIRKENEEQSVYSELEDMHKDIEDELCASPEHLRTPRARRGLRRQIRRLNRRFHRVCSKFRTEKARDHSGTEVNPPTPSSAGHDPPSST
jgi:hypothetical protein